MEHEPSISDARYVSFATFRKSGVAVATPVWCAQVGDDLFIFSDPHAGKIKRLRNSARAKLAICDVRGKVLGEWCEAEAFLVTEDIHVQQALKALRDKYGWQMWLLDSGAKLTGKFSRRAYIRVRLHGPENP